MTPTLYFAPGTVAIASAIAMREVGMEFATQRLDFKSGEQGGGDYLKVNPKGRVPALVTENGTLTESIAILEWIADTADAGLRPADPWQAAKMRELMTYLASTMHPNHAHKARGHRWADRTDSHEDMRARVPANMAESCAYLEETLPFAPFATGADLTLADPYLYIVCHWLPGDKVEIADYPRLAEWHAMMSDRPTIRGLRDEGFF